MAIKIKKQYKQADGTIIEVEGSEAEVEAFEKKQQKQKAQIEQSEKKRTILYGKDLEAIRKIVQEELAKWPRYTYDYHYHYDRPAYWYQQPGTVQPVWLGGHSTISSGQINCSGNVADPNWSISTVSVGTPGPVSYTSITGSAQSAVGVYNTKATIAGDLMASGLITNTNGGGWGAINTSNFLMSPSNG